MACVWISFPLHPQCLLVKASVSPCCSRQPGALLRWKQLALVLQGRSDQTDLGRAKSLLCIFSVGIPSCCFLLSLVEKLTLHRLSGRHSCHRSCCGLTSSIVFFHFFALVLSMCVSMCRVQKSTWGAVPHPGKLLG